MSDGKYALAVKRRNELRKRTVAEVLKNKDFYHIDKIFSTGATYFIIFGQRSSGKTFSALEHALRTYKKTGRTFVYCRRWGEDIVVKNMSRLFDNHDKIIKELFGEEAEMRYFRGAFIIHYNDADKEDETVGWAIALNQAHHVKSATFAKAKIFVFDEFLQLEGEKRLPAEYNNFRHNLSSVLRMADDAEIFLLGNTVSRYSVYFTKLGVNIRALTQGTISTHTIMNDLGEPVKIAVEWCEFNEKIGERTASYLIGSPMAVTGAWEMSDTANIPHTEGEIAHEALLCSIYDSNLQTNLGIFVRTATWKSVENVDNVYVTTPHTRQFLVIRETPRTHRYYHLSTIKDLTYSTWTNLEMMLNDIKEKTSIDIKRELYMGRVFAEDMFIGDSFYNAWLYYSREVGLKVLL